MRPEPRCRQRSGTTSRAVAAPRSPCAATARRSRTCCCARACCATSPRVAPARASSGIPLALPVMLAPIGTIGLFDAGGAATCARAAERAGTAAFVGILSVPSLEEVAAAGSAPLVFQHYVRGDRDWTLELFKRAEAAGYRALCVTRRQRRRRDPRARPAQPLRSQRDAGPPEHRRRLRAQGAAGDADLDRDRVAGRAGRAAADDQGDHAPRRRRAGGRGGRRGGDRLQPRRPSARRPARRDRGPRRRRRGRR